MGSVDVRPCAKFDIEGAGFDYGTFELTHAYASDSLTIDDSITKTVSKALSDQVSVDDSLVKLIEQALSDDLAVDDSLGKNIALAFTDNLSVSDIPWQVYFLKLTDDLTIQDAGIGDLYRYGYTSLEYENNTTVWESVHKYFDLTSPVPRWTETNIASGGWTLIQDNDLRDYFRNEFIEGGWFRKADYWTVTTGASGAWTVRQNNDLSDYFKSNYVKDGWFKKQTYWTRKR